MYFEIVIIIWNTVRDLSFLKLGTAMEEYLEGYQIVSPSPTRGAIH